MSTQDIVQKLWNLCNVLRDDGITYHQYVTELTYILFLKMANENIFTTKVSDYAISRPSYAAEAIDRILSKMLKEGDLIADVGSGTGIFSKEFLVHGYEVFGIEPNDAMRLEAEKVYGKNKLFHSVSATAERTGLPSGSISLVTAASAFHWFDIPQFYEECKRILKPDGIVCIIANARIYDSFTEKQQPATAAIV